ncbi:MAG: prepilin-type N-terminal cleavage/methylation domain-containing protein [Planctomycetes bacterium]|nr:prepilin-type N-terminal cleavage/methylation domain-containing protein [Planctomycetota bacterium]
MTIETRTPTPSPHSALRTPHSPRPGFTLVEMLVVIVIIGLLAAILIPAIYAAVTNAREAAISAEITQLEMAVESYKNANNDYPPNFYEDYTNTPWTQTVLFRHLRRVSRSAGEVMTSWDNAANGNPLLGTADPSATTTPKTQIDAAESLVFWLGGLSKSATSPLTGGNCPLIPVTTTSVSSRVMIERDNSYFEFREDRLTDLDGDGLPEYIPPQGPNVPYVYFDGRSYDNLPDVVPSGSPDGIPDDDRYAQYPALTDTAGLASQFGRVRPYVVGTNAGGYPVYANDGKFQILCAGMDGLYGNPGTSEFSNPLDRKTYLTEFSQGQAQFDLSATPGITGAGRAINYVREDFDNIANFSGGVLEDQMP